MTTTQSIIERSESLLAGITPQFWPILNIHLDTSSPDMAFIAASPELVRELVGEVKRLHGERSCAKSPIQQKSVPDIPNTWLTVNGQGFSCKCGCKLFNQPDRNVKIYFCNSCGAEHEGFPL